MPATFSVDELVVNESFINFCFSSNAEDVIIWQQYIVEYPAEQQRLREAKKKVLLLCEMVDQKHPEISRYVESAFERRKIDHNNFSTFIKIAAVFVLFLGGIAAYLVITGRTQKSNSNVATANNKNYKTLAGEKRTFILPDKTRVILNAASELVLAEDFGKTERSVTLTGEAFFEVSHNKNLPFLVNTHNFQVKVLGTKFNVKAYPQEPNEATLIQGSIELHLNNSNKKAVLLKPDEKLIAGEKYYPRQVTSPQQRMDKKPEQVKIEPVRKPDGDAEQIHETAWTQNRLVIDNQSFLSLQPMLERWFDIHIVFKDEESKAYVFTAAFEKETPEEVFLALQLSYPFHFSIKNKTIYVSK